MTTAAEATDSRIVVFAPSMSDAPVTVGILGDHGFQCCVVRDGDALCAAIARGAAAVLLTEEALSPAALRTLEACLARQEPWSDLPILFFTASDRSSTARSRTLETLAPLGNVTLLDRPVKVITLISAVRAALRARRRQYAAREAQQVLKEADRRKSEFLAVLSHELRNPLGPIRSAAYILEHVDSATGAAQRAREILDRQTAHLTRLVDDLLDLNRIVRGKIELRRARVDVREIVTATASDFSAAMQERGVAFHTVLPESSVWADADATRIAQVVGNLLHNAMKFTRCGDEVVLSLHVVDGRARISVRDSGIGIEAALLPNIFDPFVQGERTLARTEGGLGLGLALVKRIVDLHGGTVSVQSPGVGHGASFHVSLPIAAPPEMRSASVETVRGAAIRRVLVVDDNHDAAETLAELVRVLGHEAEVAYDGPGALAKTRERPFDVVLCDIGMPGMSGLEVARALRAEESAVRTRLIAVSGYAHADDRSAAVAAGFDAHLAKPADPTTLERFLV